MKTLKYYLSLTITIALFTAAFGFSIGACDTNELGTDTPDLLSGQSELGQAIYMPSFDLGGELIQEEWFDLDENPIVGEEGWHRIDYIRDPRGLVIEEIGYGVHGEPQTSLERGYATLVLEYDDHGREIYASYYDAQDQPVMVTEAVKGGSPESPELVDLAFHRIQTDYFDEVTFERHYLNMALEELHYELVDLLAGSHGALGWRDDPSVARADVPSEIDGALEAVTESRATRVIPTPARIDGPKGEETEPQEAEECSCGDDEEEDADDANLNQDYADEDEEEASPCGYAGFYDERPWDDDMDCDDEEGCFEGLECDEGEEDCWDSSSEEEIADCGYEGCHDEPLSELLDMTDRLGLAIGEALELGYPQAPDAQPSAKEAKPEEETLKSETSADDHLQPEGWTQEEDLESDAWMAEEDLEDEAWMHDDPNEPGC